MPKLTQKEYAEKQGNYCPECGGDFVEGYEITIEGGAASQECSCMSCHTEWQDVYTLSGYINLKK